MRFQELQIPAFGPFTDFSLPLPETKNDVHLIYGPNEAGKSSLLRALRYLLYGIPTRTTDSFRHQNPQLRIGATISSGSDSLTFFRKKGNRNTLLDATGNALADAALAPFLGPVNEAFFQNMFGLDTDSLRSGANSLLSAEGDLGAAIFSASRGGAPINEAIKSLESEAHEIFKDRARNTRIAAALREMKEAEAAANAETISTNRWKTLKTAISEAEGRFEEKDRLRRAHLARREFVSRCLQAIPILQKVRRLETELSEFDLPELPSDFVKRVRETEAALAAGKHSLELHARRRGSLQSAMSEISDPKVVIGFAADLDLLHRRAEQYHQNLDVLPGLEAGKKSLEAILDDKTYLEDFPAIDSGTLDRLKAGAERLNDIGNRSSQLKNELKNLDGRLKKSRKSLEGFTPSAELETLTEHAELADRFAAQKSTLPTDLSERDLLAKRAGLLRERLGIEGDPRKIRVPARQTIEQEERDRLAILEQIRDLEKVLTSCRDEISAEQAALDHLATQAAIYSPAELRDSRDSRDEIWQKILKTGRPDEALTPAIATSDEIADALHRDAGHIAKASGHQARLTTLGAKKGDLESDLKTARAALASWTVSWEENHAITLGQLPSALSAWREEWENLCDLSGELETLEARIARIQEQEKDLLKKLGGKEFDQSYRKLRASLDKANREHGEQDAIRKQFVSDELKHEQLIEEGEGLAAEGKLARSDWKELCHLVGISADQTTNATLREIEARLLTRRNLLDLLEVRSEHEQKTKFVEEYQTLLERTAESLKAKPSEPALHALFEQAKGDQNSLKNLQEQLAELDEEELGLSLQVTEKTEGLAALVSQAGSEDLELAITQFESRRSLRESLAGQTELLEGFANGATLEEFLDDLGGQDAAALSEENAGLEEEEVALQGERDRAKEALDDLLREEGKLREASDLAAQHRQHAADARAAIASDFHRFRQLHHAIAFLKQQVESYREKAQGPMVEKTSRFFKTLTGDIFDRVVARPDEQDIPRLLAVRANGEEVTTDGLSEGTRDQLYLSLRLAAIDLHLETHKPFPLIFDDLLMTFDDDRSRALFSVLEEFGKKTQILIFTHHAHLKKLVGDKVTSHELSV